MIQHYLPIQTQNYYENHYETPWIYINNEKDIAQCIENGSNS